MTQRRKFNRPLGALRYRRLFVVAVEGTVTRLIERIMEIE